MAELLILDSAEVGTTDNERDVAFATLCAMFEATVPPDIKLSCLTEERGKVTGSDGNHAHHFG